MAVTQRTTKIVLWAGVLVAWPVTQPASGEVPQTIQGYTDKVTYDPGDVVSFHASTTSPTFSLEIFRQWEYGYSRVHKVEKLPGKFYGRQLEPAPPASEDQKRYELAEQPASLQTLPHPALKEVGWVDMGWPAACRMMIPADWQPAQYLAMFRAEDGTKMFYPFFVRSPWGLRGAEEAGGRNGMYIEGYTDKRSYQAGDTIYFHVSTTEPTYKVMIKRETKHTEQPMCTMYDIPGEFYPMPDEEAWKGAGWPVGCSMVVPPEWPSGSYFVRFKAADGVVNCHPFVIRCPEPGSTSRIAFVANYHNRLAYNKWGGKSHYVSLIAGDDDPAFRSSFLRPYSDAGGLGNAKTPSQVHGFLEAQGYVLEYLTEWDIHCDPCILTNYDVVVFANHHEYVSRRVFDAAQYHHDRGGHMAFFAADDFTWQVRYEDGGDTMVCYRWKAKNKDPMRYVTDCLVTTKFKFDLLNRPPDALLGVRMALQSIKFENAEYTVQMPEHWILEGTGLQEGDTFGHMVAWGEQDYLYEASPDVDIVLYCYRDKPLDPNDPPDVEGVDTCASFYADTPQYGFPDGNGGMVFVAGTLKGWCQNLVVDSPGYEVVSRATLNIIERMLDNPPPPPPADCVIPDSCTAGACDINDDGVVNVDDVFEMLPQWGPCVGCSADVDGDAVVDVNDLFHVLENWS